MEPDNPNQHRVPYFVGEELVYVTAVESYYLDGHPEALGELALRLTEQHDDENIG